MEKIGLDSAALNLYPHQFSGGQQQRICIGRAISLKPELIVCDEAVSALDVSIQAQILNLLSSLKDQFQLTMMFISHDLSVVRYFCDEVAVMHEGKIVEQMIAKVYLQALRIPTLSCCLIQSRIVFIDQLNIVRITPGGSSECSLG